jgi:hypothetical protein
MDVMNDEIGASAPTASERAELERLRAEVARMRLEQNGAGNGTGNGERAASGHRARRWGRTSAAVVLIVLGVLCAPLSVLSVWAKSQISDTDRYVQTVAPLASDPAIQAAITTQITNQIFTYLDVDGITKDALTALSQADAVPPRVAAQLTALAVPIANGIRSFTTDQVSKVVASDAFEQVWAEAQRTAHSQLVAALTGNTSGAVVLVDDKVNVNLGPLIATVKQRLLDQGFTLASRIPAVDRQITIFRSEDVAKARTLFDVLNNVGFWVPIIGLVLLGAGVYVARNSRLALIGAGLGVAASMLVLGLVIAVLRRRYLDAVPPSLLPRDAATVLFDTLVRFLRTSLRTLGVAGLLVAAGAFLTGPSVTAVRIRSVSRRAIAAAHRGVESLGVPLSRVSGWVAPQARILRVLLVVATGLALVLWSYPTTAVVLWITVALLAGLALVQFLATPSESRALAAPGAARAVPAGG